MTILELYNKFDISLRAYNVCVSLGFNTIEDLKSFFNEHGSFKSARNCGDKTNDELIGIFFEHQNRPSSLLKNEKPRLELANFKTNNDRSVFEILLIREFNKLSVRARNALLPLFENKPPDFDLLKDEFLTAPFDAANLQNVGSLTAKEIEKFREVIVGFYSAIQSNSLTDFEKEKVILNSIVGFECTKRIYLEKFVDRKFPLLIFIKEHLKEFFELSEVDEYILKNRLHLLNEKFTLEQIAKKFKLSRERIRQKSIAILEDIDARAKVLTKLIPYCEYSNITNKNFIAFRELGGHEPIKLERDNSSPVFASYFLGVLLKNDFYSFSPLNKFRRPESIQYIHKYEEVKQVKGSYLVSKHILPKSELVELYKALILKFSERRNEAESLTIKSLVSYSITDEKFLIITAIINSEFGMLVADGGIIFPRNTSKLVFEYAAEALEKINRPAHISEILKEVMKIHPDYDSDESALRGSLGRYKSIFIYFGRSSTYGLKAWEGKKKNIKGGTIKSIIEEYLLNESEPKHITEVMNHLRKFRDTTYNSVVTNLKLDNKSKFKFYGSGYIGLTAKKYDNTAFGIEFKSAGEIEWEKIIDLVF